MMGRLQGKEKWIMIKKITAMLLALTLCAGVMAGCADKKNDEKGANDSTVTDAEDTTGAADATASDGETSAAEVKPTPEPSLTVDGNKIDTTDYVMLSIDGFDISFDEFRFYYYYMLSSYEQNYGITAETMKTDTEAFGRFKEDIVNTIKNELVTDKLARDNNIELDEEDNEIIQSNMLNAMANYKSENEFKDELKRAYLTEDLYRNMFTRAQRYNKVMDVLFANDGIYATKHEDFLKMVEDPEQFAHEVHIMVPYYSQVELDDSEAEGYDDKTLSQKISVKSTKYSTMTEAEQNEQKAKAKAVAEEALKKAKDGEDFLELVNEYGWDIGLEQDPSKGYYMKRDNAGGYPQELLDAAFALEEDQVADELTENTTYGYFIVKRLPVDMDFINENIDEMIKSNDQPAIQQKLQEVSEGMEITYGADWDKLTIDSIT